MPAVESKMRGRKPNTAVSAGLRRRSSISLDESDDVDDHMDVDEPSLTNKKRNQQKSSTANANKNDDIEHADDDDDDDDGNDNNNSENDENYDDDAAGGGNNHDEDDDNDNDDGGSNDDTSEEAEEEHIEPPAFSLATLGLQRVGTVAPPKPKIHVNPLPTLNARGMPARIRKRNRFFFDENIINDDKPLRMSLSPKKLPLRGVAVGSGAIGGSAGKSQLTPSKVLKKRKGVISRYMRSSDNGTNSNASCSSSASGSISGSTIGTTTGTGTATGTGRVGRPRKLGIKLNMEKTPIGKSATTSGKSMNARASGRGGGGGGNVSMSAKSAAAAAAAAAIEEAERKAEELAAANKRLGQSIGLRLRNLLKLPKAHKWAIAEWFYSYIDKPLFDCKNDFINYVNDLAPRLGTRHLNRHEWANIRRRMGRPRRCSTNFFNEERRELDRKRQLIRTLQSRKPGELKDPQMLACMPDKIPMPLPLGTRVTARLRAPQDGIFAGTVAAYNSLNATYRVNFERAGLGTHSIPDYEIVSENFHEMLPLHSFTKDFRPNLMSVYHTNNSGFTTHLGYTTNLAAGCHGKRYTLSATGSASAATASAAAAAGNNFNRNIKEQTATNNNNNHHQQMTPQKQLANNNAAARNALSMKLNRSDPLLGSGIGGGGGAGGGNGVGVESPLKQQLTRHHGYPMKLLEHLVLLENYIALKESKIERLSEMNAKAELAISDPNGGEEALVRGRRFHREEFQRRYASNIISIERINGEMMHELNKVQEMSSILTRNPNVQAMISPTYLREECRAKANKTVEELNNGAVKNPRMIQLLKDLTTLLIVTQSLGTGEFETSTDADEHANQVTKVLEGCMEEVRTNLVSSDNIEAFQKNVQLRLQYIALEINRDITNQNVADQEDPDVDLDMKLKEEEIHADDNATNAVNTADDDDKDGGEKKSSKNGSKDNVEDDGGKDNKKDDDDDEEMEKKEKEKEKKENDDENEEIKKEETSIADAVEKMDTTEDNTDNATTTTTTTTTTSADPDSKPTTSKVIDDNKNQDKEKIEDDDADDDDDIVNDAKSQAIGGNNDNNTDDNDDDGGKSNVRVVADQTTAADADDTQISIDSIELNDSKEDDDDEEEEEEREVKRQADEVVSKISVQPKPPVVIQVKGLLPRNPKFKLQK